MRTKRLQGVSERARTINTREENQSACESCLRAQGRDRPDHTVRLLTLVYLELASISRATYGGRINDLYGRGILDDTDLAHIGQALRM